MGDDLEQLKTGLQLYGLSCTTKLTDRMYTYYQSLMERNRQVNLTAITEWKDVVEKHFLDSLSLLLFRSPDMLFSKKILDLGSGAGFPGIPLALVLPETQFVLTDSLQKRTLFLEEICEKLSLSNVSVIHARAEDLGKEDGYREQFDIVLSRAVANLSVLCEYCLPFVKVEGFFCPYKAEEIADEVTEAAYAMKELGGELISTEHYVVPTTDLPRTVLFIQKKKRTPLRYPRKAGTPAKSPIRKR